MQAFRRNVAHTLRVVFRSMDEKSKREFLNWLLAVREIRSTPGLSYREKESRLQELQCSETVLRTMKAILDASVNQAPAQNQQIIRTSLTGLGLAASLMRMPQLSMAQLLFSQALPKFLLTPQFEVIAAALERELQEVLKELNSAL